MTARADALRLILVRHGRAEGNDPRLPDFDRQLDPRGQAEAASLGRRLAERGVRAQRVLVSPAARTLATARLLLEAMGAGRDPLLQLPQLYLAGPETLAEAVRDGAQGATSVVVVAHNPGISDFFAWLAPAATGAGFGTGEARIVDLACADWNDLGPATGLAVAVEPGRAG